VLLFHFNVKKKRRKLNKLNVIWWRKKAAMDFFLRVYAVV